VQSLRRSVENFAWTQDVSTGLVLIFLSPFRPTSGAQALRPLSWRRVRHRITRKAPCARCMPFREQLTPCLILFLVYLSFRLPFLLPQLPVFDSVVSTIGVRKHCIVLLFIPFSVSVLCSQSLLTALLTDTPSRLLSRRRRNSVNRSTISSPSASSRHRKSAGRER
jgi:hypothetical protein